MIDLIRIQEGKNVPQNWIKELVSRTTDLHHFNADLDPYFNINADPDLTFHINADPDPSPHQSDALSATTGIQTLQDSIMSVPGLPRLHCESL